MAQHDYTIANQGFPAFRSDLNNALAAIVSNNSGATEPTTMFAHQMWVDTAANPSVLKIRNADNDAWITIGTINQTGDTFTLTSAVSATTLNTSGAVVFNDAGADVDFRVEGDTDANLLFVDASADKVGIGTSGPAAKVHIAGSSATDFDALTLRNGDGTTGSAAVLGFEASTGTLGLDASLAAQIKGIRTGSGTSGALAFWTNDAGVPDERMRIDSSGNVGIGVTPSAWSASYKALQVGATASIWSGASGELASLQSNAYFNGTNYVRLITGYATGYDQSGGAHSWRIAGTSTAGSNITFTQAMTLDASGNLLVGDTTTDCRLFAQRPTDGNVFGARATFATFGATVGFFGADRNTTNNSFYYIDCYNYGSASHKLRVADSGNVTNTNNSYGQISDIKTKQDIVDAASQWDDIKNVRVRKFRFKNDPTGPLQIGVVAQELEQVSAGLIEEHPDYEEVEVPVLDDEGNPVLNEDGTPQVTKERNALGTTTKSVKYSVLYMKAVKALQEAMERIETLEAKVAALENA